MPISQSDYDYMYKIAEYFAGTITPDAPDGSIRDTALHFGINRNKVRKILITTGDLTSPITEEAVELRKDGKSIKEISVLLGVSVATVSTALPYEDKFDNSKEPTKHASEVRGYRAYEKQRVERQSKLRNGKDIAVDGNVLDKEWAKDIKMSYKEAYHRPHRKTWDDMDREEAEFRERLDGEEKEQFLAFEKKVNEIKADIEKEEQELDALREKKSQNKNGLTKKEQERLDELLVSFGLYDGALYHRNFKALEEIAGDRLPPEPAGVIRLHMELYSDYQNDEMTETLKKYGAVEYGDNISRDIVVPEDIPLYALHYVIQKAFGWENSHLRQFSLPEDRSRELCCDNAAMWSDLVGILFQSPYMDDDEQFWADDYNGGSFKNWLRKKYTGPYLSQCYGEGFMSCYRDMEELDMEEEYYVLYAKSYNPDTDKYDGDEYICMVTPVYDFNDVRREEPKPWHGDEVPHRVEIVSFFDVPANGLKFLFEKDPMALLERLPVGKVLAVVEELNSEKSEIGITEDCIEIHDKRNKIIRTGEELLLRVESVMDYILENDIDSPSLQPVAGPVTDVLLYNYDFGDNWKVRITATEDCVDLVSSGRITQTELDRANVKCREVYRPVLIARDGEMLVDDVGGLSGFCDFLQTINPDYKGLTPEEKEEAKLEKHDMIAWAKSLGWHRDKTGEFNLL